MIVVDSSIWVEALRHEAEIWSLDTDFERLAALGFANVFRA